MRRKKKPTEHDKHLEDLATELCKRGHVVKTHVEYPLGECDIIAIKNGRVVYYEVKSSKKGLRKATEQTLRWSVWMKSRHPDTNYHGVCVTPKKAYLTVRNYHILR